MSEHKARVLLSTPRDAHDAGGQPVKIDEMRSEPALEFATDGSARLAPARAIQPPDASGQVTGRLLLESDSTQARSLEGRSLAMYPSLRLPDPSRLRTLDPRPRLAAAFGEQKRPMSGFNERREPA
jgi:hypothetical protein